ncbi:MAG: ABC transporter ATP-binding protein [Lachnospiraceae bacterium]|nr:ABC transporter ATP-binding protein [Lachnospiraceae bacterium]
MIEVNNIFKSYGSGAVLTGASLKAEPGTIVAIAGRNGCGKSTFLQILAGALKPDAGQILIFGQDALRQKRVFGQYVGYVPQEDPLFGRLSVRDNLDFWAAGVRSPDYSVVETFELKDLLKTRTDTLSGGMKRRLSIACALVRRTPVLILDEPTSSLDLYYQDCIRKWMTEYTGSGGMIIMATHSIEELRIADWIYFLIEGKTTEREKTAIDEETVRRILSGSECKEEKK